MYATAANSECCISCVVFVDTHNIQDGDDVNKNNNTNNDVDNDDDDDNE